MALGKHCVDGFGKQSLNRRPFLGGYDLKRGLNLRREMPAYEYTTGAGRRNGFRCYNGPRC